MITFFILSLLYFFIFPISYLLILRWQKIKRTKVAPYKLYDAMNSWWGLDEESILNVLQDDIDIIRVYNRYHQLYNINLIEQLEKELNGTNFNKVLPYFYK